MSLEAAIQALTAAVTTNSGLLETLLAKTSGKAAAAADKPAAASKPETSSEKPAAASKPAARGKKDKVPSVDDARAKFGAYMSVPKNMGREERKANVKAILEHYGVDGVGEIPEEKRVEAMGYVDAFEKGETPNFMADDGDGDEDGDEDDGASLM